ncbi:hypothetical protein NP233_g11350 [Leucocoprinus birnbaumii]|uniref:Uncharacterized protein n=1 Tax=Leucocoprinus birnbaumii TaxID=56174 RepID=A0AAD5YLD0_9AGAR|nr:hypothetical protein NP233_g11350 [Leucocoprinus birnbaumii]
MTSFMDYVVRCTRSNCEYSGIPRKEVEVIRTHLSHDELGFLVEDALDRADGQQLQHLDDITQHSENCPEGEEEYDVYRRLATLSLSGGKDPSDVKSPSSSPSPPSPPSLPLPASAPPSSPPHIPEPSSTTIGAPPSSSSVSSLTLPGLLQNNNKYLGEKRRWELKKKRKREEQKRALARESTEEVKPSQSNAGKLNKKMGAWTERLREAKKSQTDPSQLISELVDDPDEPYQLVKWDRVTPKVIVDTEDTVIGALAGRPDDDSYLSRCSDLFDFMSEQAKTAKFTTKNLNHRRGPYPSSDTGITFGPGDQHIHYLRLQKEEARLAEELMQHGVVCDIHGFVESSIDVYAKRLYAYFKSYMDKIRAHPSFQELEVPPGYRGKKLSVRAGYPDPPDPDPVPPDYNVPSNTQSWPPDVATEPHCDVMNLAFGWCGIVPLGRYKPERSALFVIHTLRLIIEFPPGSCILIPSAFLWHSNIPIHPDDQRASITFYASNGLFRFVDNDFQLEKDLKLTNKELYDRISTEALM